MDFAFACVLLGFSALSFFNCRNSTVRMIKEIGTDSRYYPKRYASTKGWMKKTFHIRQQVIPKYLFFEFYMALVFAILEPFNLIIYCVTNGSKTVLGIGILVHTCLIVVNMFFFVLMSTVFKNSKCS